MNMYHIFMGIDIGKAEIVVAIKRKRETSIFANNTEGFELLYTVYQEDFKNAFNVAWLKLSFFNKGLTSIKSLPS